MLYLSQSFYLPGSVDVNDNQIEDWNRDPPPLYLWSRPDWTAKHRAIAEQHGHSSGTLKNYRPDNKSQNDMLAPNSAQESHSPTVKSPVKHNEDLPVDKPQNLQRKDTVATTTSPKEWSKKKPTPPKDPSASKPKNFGGKGKKNNRRSLEDKSEFGRKGKKTRRSMEYRPSNKFSGPLHLSPNMPDHETRSRVHSDRVDYPHFSRRSNQPYSQTRYNNPNDEMEDVVNRYYMNGEEPLRGTTSNSRPEYAPPDYSFGAPNDQWVAPLDDTVGTFAEPNPWNERPAYPPTYPGAHFPSPYGEMGTSAMQRYAPRLDEMNHARVVPGPPGNVVGPTYHPPQTGPLGFAPRPYHHSYSQQNSSGWLND